MNDVAKRWVEALRSGEYKQGKYALKSVPAEHPEATPSYCCLGVLCDLAVKAGITVTRGTNAIHMDNGVLMTERYGIGTNGSAALLPNEVREWAGVRTDKGAIIACVDALGTDSLMALNDIGRSFVDIAAIIEAEPAGLFVDGAING